MISERSVLIEYVMLAGINDSEEVAHQLGLLLKDCKVVGHLSFPLLFQNAILELHGNTEIPRQWCVSRMSDTKSLKSC